MDKVTKELKQLKQAKYRRQHLTESADEFALSSGVYNLNLHTGNALGI